jgi:hypothetical protein
MNVMRGSSANAKSYNPSLTNAGTIVGVRMRKSWQEIFSRIRWERFCIGESSGTENTDGREKVMLHSWSFRRRGRLSTLWSRWGLT